MESLTNGRVAVEIESEIQELVQKEASRQSTVKGGDDFVDSVCKTILRVASKSMVEIDELIAELTHFRDRLQNDSKNVQSEIAHVESQIDAYTRTNEGARESIHAIGQCLGHFKRRRPEPLSLDSPQPVPAVGASPAANRV